MTDANVKLIETAAIATSVSLLERAKLLDQVAWERIVDLYGPLVYRWCRRRNLQDTDAQDVGQTVFKSVFLSLGTFRRDRENDSFRKWLKKITYRKVIDHLRARQSRSELIDTTIAELNNELSDESIRDSEDELSENKELLNRALQQIRSEFKVQTWNAFLAHVLEGLNPTETANRYQMSVNSVYLAKSRIIHRLREVFGELIDDLYGI